MKDLLLNPKPTLGITDTETVKLDFDNTAFKYVRYWALRTMRWFKLEGFLILKSSKNSYHVVFNRSVSWTENMRIVAWVWLHSHSRKLGRWFTMQCIKKASTLRIGPKGGKPSPRIICHYGKQDEEIRNFLHYRKLLKGFVERLETELLVL